MVITHPAPFYLEHSAYNSQIHMAARYVVKAVHKTESYTLLADVVIPAGISSGWRRRAVEKTIQAEFSQYHLPSRGDAPWFIEHHEDDEF